MHPLTGGDQSTVYLFDVAAPIQAFSLLEWVGLTGLSAVVTMLWITMRRQARQSKTTDEINVALMGYQGTGGMIHQLEELEDRVEGMPKLARDAKHDAVNAMQQRLTEVELAIKDRITEVEKHLTRQIEQVESRVNTRISDVMHAKARGD